jgi:hypothetical protein
MGTINLVCLKTSKQSKNLYLARLRYYYCLFMPIGTLTLLVHGYTGIDSRHYESFVVRFMTPDMPVWTTDVTVILVMSVKTPTAAWLPWFGLQTLLVHVWARVGAVY